MIGDDWDESTEASQAVHRMLPSVVKKNADDLHAEGGNLAANSWISCVDQANSIKSGDAIDCGDASNCGVMVLGAHTVQFCDTVLLRAPVQTPACEMDANLGVANTIYIGDKIPKVVNEKIYVLPCVCVSCLGLLRYHRD